MIFKISKCSFFEKNYPRLLKEIHSPPKQLYYRGNFAGIDFERCISIVGSRNYSQEALLLVRKLIGFLEGKGFVIVSGLASGIDSMVHRECLNKSIRTLAILPLGLDNITPKRNSELYWEIIENNGVCISEDYKLNKYNKFLFPRRNRIIAGLSMATIVIEAGVKSGALITADLAFSENRSVYAFPGSIFNNHAIGSNMLIKNLKAKILVEFNDILNDYRT
jgi:DNA processing protein